MKRNRIAAIVIAVMNIILIVICTVFYFSTDRVSPEFKFQLSSLTYAEDMDREELLKDITAYDNKDGDVTERIVIEKIVENKAESSIVVFYAASDKAGNVAKISRVFPASLQDEENETIEWADAGKDGTARGTEEGNVSAGASGIDEMAEDFEAAVKAGTEEDSEDAGEEAGIDEEEAEDVGEEADTDEEEAEGDAEETGGEETAGNAESIDEERENTGGNRADNRGVERNGKEEERPIITLKTSEVTTRAGVAPAWVEVISSLKDDKDSYETLFYNLSVSKYDLNKTGTYKVALTTKDSDGNTSEPVTVTIYVK